MPGAWFYVRTAGFYWRTHLAVALSVSVAVAVLAGALIVGDSMRYSLRELAVGRLGRVECAMTAARLFREGLAEDLSSDAYLVGRVDPIAPMVMLRGGLTHAERRNRVNKVNILGVDERYWTLNSDRGIPPRGSSGAGDRHIILNQPLADELQARVGDDVVVHLGKPSAVSAETLLGRRDDATATLRLTVGAIVAPRGLAAFELNPRQTSPKNAFVPLATLQRAIDQPGRANMLLVAPAKGKSPQAVDADELQLAASRTVSLADVGLSIRRTSDRPEQIVENDALLIEPALEEAVVGAATHLGSTPTRVLAYLANGISKVAGADGSISSGPLIPYSIIAAVEPQSPWAAKFAGLAEGQELRLSESEIILNEWAAADLNVRTGDAIEIAFYVTDDSGGLQTRSARFTLAGTVPLRGVAADPELVPPYKGVTDARSLADWDPPFSIDLKLIRDKDEEYWKDHRTTPKAFITLADGQRLWAEDSDRFGRVTSIRISEPDAQVVSAPGGAQSWSAPPDHGVPSRDFKAELEREILSRLDLPRLGLRFEPVRERLIAASSGPTDFGMLFVSFSFFLIVSGALLVALLFRLGVEKRAFEVGLFLAEGYSPRAVTRMLLLDGLIVSLAGVAIGLAGAAGFAWLMLAGLRSWWSAAVNTPLLILHIKPSTLAIGAGVGLAVALLTVAWSVRGLARRSPRALLAGALEESPIVRGRTSRASSFVAGALIVVCALVGAVSALHPDVTFRSLGFFVSGAAALGACLAAVSAWLTGRQGQPITVPGPGAILRMGVRSARRNPRRSLLTAGLIAGAVFVIVSLEAFRLDPGETGDRRSGSGGYALYAESAVPILHDVNTLQGREALNLTEPAAQVLGATVVTPFRLRPGDDSSCLNLYRPGRPRILGAGDQFISRGGFRFSDSLAAGGEEGDNPWLLLHRTFPDGAIPAIADQNAVRWQYHLGLGRDLIVQDQRGRDIALRFVALLSGSVLQDEIVVAEDRFTALFPSISGRSFFLIETPQDEVREVERTLEAGLAPFGFDASTTASRLRHYFAVQNTYLSTFQTLGGLGLLLGAAGLAAVLVRNVWERRRELALMRTAGFTRRWLAMFVLAENAALVLSGLGAGVASALLAIAPMAGGEASSIPWGRLSLTLLGVIVVGLGSGLIAVRRALRAPLIPALRNE